MNIERIKKDFANLVSFDSVTYGERATADWLLEELKALGFSCKEDDAGSYYHGNAGNIYGILAGNTEQSGILLSAHMDVVEPGRGKKAIFQEGGIISSDGTTVLGGDDICGIVEILEGIRMVREENLLHGDIEVLFTIGEETYTKGAAVFDYSQVRAKNAYVLDMSGPIGSAAVQAPTIISYQLVIHGKSAHAGFSPEEGIHAIEIMSKIIAEMKEGHTDEETTFNVGLIEGGTATNIVPDQCKITGEIRSYQHEKAMEQIKKLEEKAEKYVSMYGATFTLNHQVDIKAYKISEQSQTAERFQKAVKEMGKEAHFISTFGGSDNNQFVEHGIEGIVLSCGMYNVHTTKEYARLSDLTDGAELVMKMIIG